MTAVRTACHACWLSLMSVMTLQALRVISQADGRVASDYRPPQGIQIATAQGPVVAIATGQRVECLLLEGGAGTLSPLAAWQFEQQVSALALLDMPDGQGGGSQVCANEIFLLHPCWFACIKQSCVILLLPGTC